MTKENVIGLAKNFNQKLRDTCCERLDEFKQIYNKEAYWIECGNPWSEESQKEYIEHGYLATDFVVDGNYDHMSSEKQLQLDIAVTKSYIDSAVEQEGVRPRVICAILHDYFGEFLDKI